MGLWNPLIQKYNALVANLVQQSRALYRTGAAKVKRQRGEQLRALDSQVLAFALVAFYSRGRSDRGLMNKQSVIGGLYSDRPVIQIIAIQKDLDQGCFTQVALNQRFGKRILDIFL